MIEVTVRHNFETGHRLPHLPGKCQSLHGHSWWAHITIGAGAVDSSGVLLDFGQLKGELREWIDAHLDHGLMLGHDDPLLDYLSDRGRVFEFTPELGSWPTVENVARLLSGVAKDVVAQLGSDAQVLRVRVTETHVNEASWTR